MLGHIHATSPNIDKVLLLRGNLPHSLWALKHATSPNLDKVLLFRGNLPH